MQNNQQNDSSSSLTSALANADQQKGTKEPSSRKSTGPRTQAGKQRSKLNAIKHGIRAKGIVLENESLIEFESLWSRLSEDMQPQGALEEETFIDYFWNRWSKRRFLRAKNAEIAENVKFSKVDNSRVQEAQAWDTLRWGCASGGSLKPSSNHFDMRTGKEILKQIRRSVETGGFNVEDDSRLLKTAYGLNVDGTAPFGIFTLYLLAGRCASLAEDGEQKVSADELKNELIEQLDKQIIKLTAMENAALDEEVMRGKFRVDRALILSQASMDRYMHYETHLDREGDRILRRFDHLQRVRLAKQIREQ